MKILHTSDWHLGSTIHGKRRYQEYEAFLSWLLVCVETEKIDVILISGDIFDTTNPGTRSIEQYFNFLGRIPRAQCRHIVVTAGNHDSPSLLNAPKELLRTLNIHAIGSITEEIDDEILILRDAHGVPSLLVCAVPYLRDRDIRLVEAGEETEVKTQKLLLGIEDHYRRVCERAIGIRDQVNPAIPIIAMGHLFAAGGSTVDGDGVRELYIGNLVRVDGGMVPASVDYCALGHLHSPQKVNGCEKIRYCGAPVPMGFSESGDGKSVTSVEFDETGQVVIREIPVPQFLALASIRGDLDTILSRLDALKRENKPVWVEITLDDERLIPDVTEQVHKQVRDSPVEVLKITNLRVVAQALHQIDSADTLADLNLQDVFLRCLETANIPSLQRQELIDSYSEILRDLTEEDELARGDLP
ncbi:MAG: exonuclease SbcCD subunit D C-terminal domain-containing protein [Methanoregula sp.]